MLINMISGTDIESGTSSSQDFLSHLLILLGDPRLFLVLLEMYFLCRVLGVVSSLRTVLASGTLAWALALRLCPSGSFLPYLGALLFPVYFKLCSSEKLSPVSGPSAFNEERIESSGKRVSSSAFGDKSGSAERTLKNPSESSSGKSSAEEKSCSKSSSQGSKPSKSKAPSRRQRKNFRKKVLKDSLRAQGEKEEISTASSQYSSGSSDSGVCSGNNDPKEDDKKVEDEPEDEFNGFSSLACVPMSYGGFRQCKQFIKLGLSQSDIYFNLLNYLLTPDQLLRLSYPMDQESSKKTISSELNISAKVFVPKTPSSGAMDLKTCVRCLSTFSLKDYENEGESSHPKRKRKNVCTYHYGKVRVSKTFGHAYTCCGGPSERQGCTAAPYHVWSDSSSSVSGRGYVKTRRSKSIPFGVYSLDCEMAFTTSGMELVKVTVISVDGSPVYESFVRPDTRIVDHNTRFSGVTAKDLTSYPTKTLKQVQSDLLRIISADTILIGHALDNDFRALRLIHDKVVDTAVLFPHFYGIPYRRSLKSLAEIYLKRRIQTREMGHDPYEDALASVELILWKMRKDLDEGLTPFL
eukprot:TRINITY_DN7354_c0_g1_i1.p1 TRINITY_DN7354_c0_g1~~TRINITY_DN7354_c0_g1_i1.p1  ORF type:complete len:579 (-),score=153.88 TRINITY_DN7354_c0_g1_i1:367-2103(-)